jgi:glutamate-ammonia-ligase adenylyltransferase
LESYYAGEAETWEYLALTRARVAWASAPAFAAAASAVIEAKLRAARDAARTAADVRDMRALMARERPPSGFWDFKLTDGGLVDIEFAAQFLQLVHAADGGPLAANTAVALAAMADRGLAPRAALADLAAAWRLQQDLAQIVKVALADDGEPEREPRALRALLARAAGVRDHRALRALVARRRKAAHAAFGAIVGAA